MNLKNPSSEVTGIIFSKQNSNNNSRNEIISTGKTVPLNLFEINSNNNSKAFIFRFIKNNGNKLLDNLFIQFGTIRFNLFSDYISSYLNIMSEYKSILKQPIIHSMQNIDNGIKIQKELYKMKKYIYNYMLKIPDKKSTNQMKDYKLYLKNEIDKAILLGAETEHFEINYLMSFFNKGFDINFDYDSIEFVYYSNEKKVCGKGVIPPSEFQFRVDSNNIKIKFFDFEFEINDLTNAKFLMTRIMKIFEEKLNMTKLFIEPCITQLRDELNKTKKKNKKLESEKKKEFERKNKKLENMLLLVQDHFNKKDKDIRQNDEDIVNYKNMMDSKDTNRIKDYKQPKFYAQTLQDNEDEEINDIDNDDLYKYDKINIKESKKPNNFYNNIIEDNKKNENNSFINISNFNNSKKNSPKNNLPKVNKK